MPRKTNEKYREVKRNEIIENARLVFYRKGYLNVTMKDIIEECGISRGGIYLYFSSTDEIFQEVVLTRNKERFSVIRNAVENNEPFNTVLRKYMALQKERLLNMDNSLLRAVYEYNFSKAGEETQNFRIEMLDSLRKSLLYILTLGVKQSVIQDKSIDIIADNFLLIIEGMGVLALAKMLTEKIINEQFAVINAVIENIRV